MALARGTRLGQYEIAEALGAGGMGEVYRARHVRLKRDDAIKVLPPALTADRVALGRFEREARSASALNHPNIITIHDIAEDGGVTFIAMELVEGRTLRDVIRDRPMPVGEVMRVGIQLANALARAHDAGIVHRDLKPSNVMVTPQGVVKVLDFGLAKAIERMESQASGPLTHDGVLIGTPMYMSPEQFSGEKLDHRSDHFAFGVLLYEMLAGHAPFDGPSHRALALAIMSQEPKPLRQRRPDVPPELEALVNRCLAKNPADRFQTTEQLLDAVRSCGGIKAAPPSTRWKRIAIPAGALLAAGILGSSFWRSGSERRWAEASALAEIGALVDSGRVDEAFDRSLSAAKVRGPDTLLQRVVERFTLPLTINTKPAGAEVYVRAYDTTRGSWHRLGVTPLETRVPYAMLRWRLVKAGYEPFEGAPFATASFAAVRPGLPLDSAGARPADMIRVPDGAVAGLPQAIAMPAVTTLKSYLLDRFEVTNAQYQAFVDSGGYLKPELWRMAQRDADTTFDPVTALVDRSGRPGPAGWELGRHPAGAAELPVSGVSWFEAATYCAWKGRQLPTLYHWFTAIGQLQLSDILRFSNFDGVGKTRVGERGGLAAFGTYDMAGNVKEWALNASGNRRFALGGAWNEPGMFRAPHAQDPWSRSETNGFRCARYDDVPAVITGPIALQRVVGAPAAVSDTTFALLKNFYAYEKTPLDARVEWVNDSVAAYRHEVVSIRTAYSDERMRVNLLIPRDVPPPWQSVMWFPGADVFSLRQSPVFSSAFLFDFIPRTGRVVVYPTYDGMHNRFTPGDASAGQLRERMVHWSKDIGRTIDYLGTRTDFDTSRVAYYGFSGGANFGPIFLALEPRFRAGILLGAGLNRARWSPDNHPMVFAPRVRAPTLIINGHDDFLLEYETSQKPLFDAIGVADSLKRLVRLSGGHIPERLDIVREALAWLDRYLGPIKN